jgi:FkbM family methyltransferase
MNHFLDIGANIGQTFDWYLNKTHDYDGWHVWCFEPSPRNLVALIDRAQHGDILHKHKVTICAFGIGGEWKAMPFFQTTNPVGDSFHKQYRVGAEVSKNLELPYDLVGSTMPLAEFIRRHIPDGEKCVVKLDCEGGEYGALRSLLCSLEQLKKCSKIMVEWHDTMNPDDDKDRLIATFKAIGYELELWPY